MSNTVEHLFFATPDWNDLWLTQQPVSDALSRRGEDVLYIPFQTSFLRALNPRHGAERKKIMAWIKGSRRDMYIRGPYITEYFPPPMWHLGSRFPQLIEAQIRRVGQLTKKRWPRNNDCRRIIWVDHPFGWVLRDVFPDDLFVGYIIDDIRPFPHVHSMNIEGAEKKLAEKTDMMVVVTSSLKARYQSYGANVLLERNGAPIWVSNLAKDENKISPHSILQSLDHPVLGYIGSIQPFVDLALLRSVVDTYPQCTLVLIGPVHIDERDPDWIALKQHPRVFLYPAVPYEQVGACVAGFDVCLLPFKQLKLMAGADPGKVNVYLGMGKPMVATRINVDIERHGDVAYIADNTDIFVKLVGKALVEENRDEIRQARRSRVLSHTWDHVAQEIRSYQHNAFDI